MNALKENFSAVLDQNSATLKQTQATLQQITGDPSSPPYVWLEDFRKKRSEEIFTNPNTSAEFQVVNPSKMHSVYLPALPLSSPMADTCSLFQSSHRIKTSRF